MHYKVYWLISSDNFLSSMTLNLLVNSVTCTKLRILQEITDDLFIRKLILRNNLTNILYVFFEPGKRSF